MHGDHTVDFHVRSETVWMDGVGAMHVSQFCYEVRVHLHKTYQQSHVLNKAHTRVCTQVCKMPKETRWQKVIKVGEETFKKWEDRQGLNVAHCADEWQEWWCKNGEWLLRLVLNVLSC